MLRLWTAAAALLLLLSTANGWGAPRHGRHVLRMEATAFVRDGEPTAAGTIPHDGVAAADPAILPLGSRIRVTGAGAWSGYYIVTDTGSKVVGYHIDLLLPSTAAAKQFGKKIVDVRVLRVGTGKQEARAEDIPAPKPPVTH